jgi:hypothetical protein
MGIYTGDGQNDGPLEDITYPNIPAPERMLGDYITLVSGVDREPKPAPLESGLQPKTEMNPEGQVPPMRLSGVTW